MARNSRKIVFVNGLGESLTLQTSPYLISKIDGLGIPSVDRQEQKAPYQDGTTYIDSLLQNRDISIEIDISSGPNNFTEIDTRRRELSQKLCPKYGSGILTYTTEGGQSYTIAAVPYSVVFPNKDYRGPYARALVTFTCNDPYWKKTTSSGITLPTSVTSAEITINAAPSSSPRIIQQSDESFRVAYIRNSDHFLVQRTSTDGVSWSSESVISAAYVKELALIQQSDDSFRISYIRNSDSFLVQRTSADGITWSAESVINAATSLYHDILQQLDTTYRVIYLRNTDGALVQRTSADGITWSAESVIRATQINHSRIIQQKNGTLRVVGERFTDAFLIQRVSDDNGITWGADSVINAAASTYPAIIQQADETYFVIYRENDGYIHRRISSDGIAWSSSSVVSLTTTDSGDSIQQQNGDIRIVYTSTGSAIVSSVRTVTPVLATIVGDVSTPCQILFNGPSVNPRIWHGEKLEYLYFNMTLAAGDSMVINTSFGNKTVVLTQGGIEKNGIAYLDISSTFFQLDRGTNTVYYEDDSVASTATATMEWTERYIGV